MCDFSKCCFLPCALLCFLMVYFVASLYVDWWVLRSAWVSWQPWQIKKGVARHRESLLQHAGLWGSEWCIYLEKYFNLAVNGFLTAACIARYFCLFKPQCKLFTCRVSEKQMFVWLGHQQIWRSPACWHLIELFTSHIPYLLTYWWVLCQSVSNSLAQEKANGSLWWDKGDREG